VVVRHAFRLGQRRVAARRGHHGGFAGVGLHQAQYAVGADVEDGGHLVQHAGSEFAQRMDLVQVGGAGQDLAQADARTLQHVQALIRAQGRDHGGEQLLRGELGLGLVIVDVVFDDHALLGRLARLAGAQHYAHDGVVQFLADAARQQQAGIVGFHHHVEQDQGDVGRIAQDFECFPAAIGGIQFQLAALEADIAQGQAGNRMHVLVVVDNQHAPQALFRGGGRRRLLVFFVLFQQPVVIDGMGIRHEVSLIKCANLYIQHNQI
jgi:hypothetical protein